MRFARLVSLVALLMLLPTHASPQSGSIMPLPIFTGFDNNGNPCSGCKLYTYAAGTTTPQNTYADSALTTPLSNPIILNSAGRAVVYISATSYKFILKSAADVTIWTVDNVASVLVGQAIGETFAFAGDSTSPVTVTTYPSGTTSDKCHAGSAIFVENSTNLPGTYILEGMLLGTGSVTASAALVNLSDGSPDTAMVTISSTSTTGALVQSSAITFAAAGSNKNYCVKTKVGSGSGYVWGLKIRRTS